MRFLFGDKTQMVEPGDALLGEADPSAERLPGPYVAETYPVSLEGRYVVVDLGGPAASRPPA